MDALEIFICPECLQQRYRYEQSANKKYCKKCHAKKCADYKKRRQGSKPCLSPDYRVFDLKKFPRS